MTTTHELRYIGCGTDLRVGPEVAAPALGAGSDRRRLSDTPGIYLNFHAVPGQRLVVGEGHRVPILRLVVGTASIHATQKKGTGRVDRERT